MKGQQSRVPHDEPFITYLCDACDRRLEVDADMLGRKVACPYCGNIAVVRRSGMGVGGAGDDRPSREAAARSGDPGQGDVSAENQPAAAPTNSNGPTAMGLPEDWRAGQPELHVLTVHPVTIRAKPLKGFGVVLGIVLALGGGVWLFGEARGKWDGPPAPDAQPLIARRPDAGASSNERLPPVQGTAVNGGSARKAAGSSTGSGGDDAKSKSPNSNERMFLNIGGYVCLALAAVGFGILVFWWILKRSVALVITNKRTTLREGLFSRHSREVLHDRIQDIQVTQTFMQRVLRTGSLGISNSGDAGIEIQADDLPNPVRIRRIIDAYRGDEEER